MCFDQSRGLDIQHFLKVFKVGNRTGCDSDFFPADCFFPPSFTQNMPDTYVPRVKSIHREQDVYSHCPCRALGLLAETDNEPAIMPIMSSLHI